MLNSVENVVSTLGVVLASLVAEKFSFTILFIILALTRIVSAIPIVPIDIPRAATGKGHQVSVSLVEHFRFLKKNLRLTLLLASLFIMALFTFGEEFYPDFVKREYGVGAFEMGIFGMISSAVWAVAPYSIGHLADPVDKRKLVMLGYILMGLPWLFFTEAPSVSWLYLLYLVYMLGNCVGYYTTLVISDMAPEGRRTTAVGLMNGLITASTAISGLIGGVLWEVLGFFVSLKLVAIAYLLEAVVIAMVARQ